MATTYPGSSPATLGMGSLLSTSGDAWDPMENLLGTAGFDWERELTPAQQFMNYATMQFRPGAMRDALYSQQMPLTQRYLLGLGGQRAGMQPGGTFGQFLGAYGAAPSVPSWEQGLPSMPSKAEPATRPEPTPYKPRSVMELRELAEAANVIGGMTGEQYQQYAGDPGAYTGAGWQRLAPGRGLWPGGGAGLPELQQQVYRSQYGTAQGAEENRRQLALMLALQRGGGQMQGGIVREAITGALNELYSTMFAQQGGGGDFLDWYLQRTRQPRQDYRIDDPASLGPRVPPSTVPTPSGGVTGQLAGGGGQGPFWTGPGNPTL